MDEIQLIKNKLVGETKEVFSYISNKRFNDGMANKLQLGSKIYTAKVRGDMLLVEYDAKVKKYLALVEG